MSHKRVLCFILALVLISTILGGCYDSHEIDELGFVIAMGVDKGKTNSLKLTFQLAKPQGGGEGGGGAGGSESGYMQVAVEAPSIYAGIDMLNTFNSKQINVSHIKTVVFSKELSQEGLLPYLNAIVRGNDFRPNMHIVVARGSAEDYLSAIKPQLVLNTPKYYDLLFQGHEYTGYFADVEFHDFYNKTKSLFRNPVAILGAVTSFITSEDFTLDNSTYKEHDRDYVLGGDFLAGDITQTGGVESEIMGLAVFDGDKMVGEIDGSEARLYLLCTGEYGRANWTIPDPEADGKFIMLNIQQSRQPNIRVNLDGEAPKIELKLNLEGDFMSIQSGINYEKDLLSKFEAYFENLVKAEILSFLEKMSKEYHSDIFGFGSYAKNQFLTWKEWENYNWKNKFQNSVFSVEVNFKARRPGLVMKSNPALSSEGEVGEE